MAKAIRYSKQREKIYEYLLHSEEHPTAEMIYAALKEELPALSLGTVYRNLTFLQEQGKVRKVTTFQGIERYDAICGDHAHFLCVSCGAITDLCGVDAQRLRNELDIEDGYRVTNLDMMVSGRCPRCARQVSSVPL